jgi:DNA-binding MarR family transcriptional regulator
LTTEGTFVAATIDNQMNAYLNEIFSHMNDFERETVIRSVKLLNEAMSKAGQCCEPTQG